MSRRDNGTSIKELSRVAKAIIATGFLLLAAVIAGIILPAEEVHYVYSGFVIGLVVIIALSCVGKLK